MKYARVVQLIVLIFLFSCEEEINKPVFQTIEVSELTDQGVTFNGNISLIGNSSPDDYGFVWSTSGKPDLTDSHYYFCENPSTGAFELRINHDLLPGTLYFVRTFLKLPHVVMYGNTVEFTSLGSATPVINDFTPQSGSSLDVITINGENFTEIKSNVSVKIGEVTCQVLTASLNKLTVKIPPTYFTGQHPITLDIAGKTVQSATNFTLEGPVVESIAPTSGPAGTIVTLTGSGFSTSTSDNKVFIGGQGSVVTEASATQLKVIVPVNSTPGPRDIQVKINNATGISPILFTLTGPTITSFSPASGVIGSHVTISGDGFSTILSENKVTIGDYYNYAQVISATPTQLVVEVPSVYYSGTGTGLATNIIVEVKSIIVVSASQFIIEGPSITSFDPPAQYEGRIVTILGNNFDPNGNTRVFFSNQEVSVLSSTPTSMTVEVPFGNPSLPSDCPITLQVGNFQYYSHYTILNPWQEQADFPGGQRYGSTAFTLGSFAYVTMGISEGGGDRKDVWRYNPANSTWTKMADFPGQSRAFAFSFVINGKAYVGGGGHYGYSLYDLISNLYDLWEYDPIADSWTQKQSLSPTGISGRRFQATGIGQYGYFGTEDFFFRYDPSQDQWWVFNASVRFSTGGVAATIGDKGYFGLGINNSSLWEFDPQADTWTEMPVSPMYLPAGSGTLTSFTVNDNLYVGDHNTLYRFNPQSNEWKRQPTIPIVLSYKSAFGVSNMGYMVNGLDGTPFGVFYRFNPNY